MSNHVEIASNRNDLEYLQVSVLVYGKRYHLIWVLSQLTGTPVYSDGTFFGQLKHSEARPDTGDWI
jgi:hypothetical protein